MKKILAIVGMPGSGKSAASTFFKAHGMPVVRFGDAVDEGLKEKGLAVTEENERQIREGLRKEFGMAAMAIQAQSKIQKALEISDMVVIDGMYSWEEYLYEKEKYPEFLVLHMYASPKVRYARLANRNVRPLSEEEAKSRDIAEITNLNKGGPIAMADYVIKNEASEEVLQKELEIFLSIFL